MDEDTWNRLFALEGAFNALLVTLRDAGILDVDKFHRHLCRAANEVEEHRLPEIAGVMDEMRKHYDELLQRQPTSAKSS